MMMPNDDDDDDVHSGTLFQQPTNKDAAAA